MFNSFRPSRGVEMTQGRMGLLRVGLYPVPGRTLAPVAGVGGLRLVFGHRGVEDRELDIGRGTCGVFTQPDTDHGSGGTPAGSSVTAGGVLSRVWPLALTRILACDPEAPEMVTVASLEDELNTAPRTGRAGPRHRRG